MEVITRLYTLFAQSYIAQPLITFLEAVCIVHPNLKIGKLPADTIAVTGQPTQLIFKYNEIIPVRAKRPLQSPDTSRRDEIHVFVKNR